MTAITRRRGDTYGDEVLVTNRLGQAVPISGCTFVMTVDSREAPTDATTNLYSLVGTILDATGGRVEFAPSAVQANQLPDIYYYDVQMVDSAGRKRTILMDKYIYTQDISKA